MKTVKKSFIRFFDKIIVLIVGVSGFSACFAYGMPYADFELKGIVTDEATSQPIKNIRVVRPHFPGFEHENMAGDTIYTDKNGKYAFIFDNLSTMKYQLKFEDIDGEENGGLFQTKEIVGEFTQADQVKKSHGWYEGKFVKKQDVELKRIEMVAPEYGVLATSFQP